jgi:hypothetical protein
MKKQLLALALMGTVSLSAQPWSENFNSTTGTSLPAGWLQNNVDGLSADPTYWSALFNTNAWLTDISGTAAYGRSALSISAYIPGGISNDWLISPSFTVPANAILNWEAVSLGNSSFLESYKVLVSTTGTLVTDFTNTLVSVSNESNAWTARSQSLSAFVGQVIRVAFVNFSNDKLGMELDNISVVSPIAIDGSVVNMTGISRYMAAGNQNIQGTFGSFGISSVTTAVLNYKVNNGSVITQTFSFSPNLNYGQSANYSFSTPASLVAGSARVKTWVSQVNGVNEVNNANDTAYANIYVASTAVTRNALIEEWSSSTCNPCAGLNATFDPLVNTNNPNSGGDVNVIKYQVNWPSPNNDPSFNAHGNSRVAHYDIQGAPTAITNGRTEMNAHDQAEINAAKAEPAFANMTATLTANGSTNAAVATTVVASATIIPRLTITTASPLRVFQALVQSYYNYPAASTTQKDYYHVMRKMNPNGWGSPITVTDGTPIVVNFSNSAVTAPINVGTPAQMSFNFWTTPTIRYEYVVFVQDTISNHVIQSASWSATVAVPTATTGGGGGGGGGNVGIVQLANNQSIGVYPSPAQDFAVIAVVLEKAATVNLVITDIGGKQVYTNANESIDAGKHEIKIDTSNLPAGTYFIKVDADGLVYKDKLLISK